MSEDEVFKVIKSGKRKKKQWKRMVNKATASPLLAPLPPSLPPSAAVHIRRRASRPVPSPPLPSPAAPPAGQVSFVGESFTRKPPKFERFVRPAALRFKKAHVTHPELKATFQLDLIGARRAPAPPSRPRRAACGARRAAAQRPPPLA